MEPDFWHQRWQQNLIGFHQAEGNPYLRQYWGELGVAAPARVLVPLCGKSYDLMWLHQQGYHVEGVELSELAVRAFFVEQGLTPHQHKVGEYSLWEGEGIRLWCGDFFKLTAAQLGPIDAVYDRAALIALPPPMRQAYVRQLQTLVGDVPHLLVTLEYPQGQMDGPPFSVEAAEVARLFGGRYRGTQPQVRADILSQDARLRERGLTRLHESVYLLQPGNK